MEWKSWIGKEKVFIKSKDGSTFTNCKVIDVNENFIYFIDKYSMKVMLSISEISKIKEDVKNE